MHRLRVALALVASGLGVGQLHAQTLPAQHELDAISARGRALAAYDHAAWLGTDAILDLSTEGITHYIARQTDTAWIVAFGRLSADADTFLVLLEATPQDDTTDYEARILSPSRADVDYLARAARAVDTSVEAFGTATRPYNVAVLPKSSGDWWVYLYPAPTQTGVWTHGSDVRYRVSADGRRVLEERRLHKEVIEYASPPQGTRSGVHTAVLADIVEDTDVFLVLSRQPRMPELVVTRSFLFTIDVDGRIRCTKRY